MPEEEKLAVTEQQTGSADQDNLPEESSTPKEPRPGTKEFNFRQLEKQKAEMERRLQEQEQRNREMQQVLQNLSAPKQSEQKDELPSLAPDDIPEWKHVTSAAKRIAREEFQELLKKKELEEMPRRAKSRYNDYDEVVTADRIKELETTNPELASAICKADDPWTATYSVLKIMHKKSEPDHKALEEAEKIAENAKKPNSINAVSKGGALKNAHSFSKKSKDQLYKEMMGFASKG